MGKFASGRKLRGCGCLGVQGAVAGPDLVPAVCLLVREDNDRGLGASAEIKQTCTWGGHCFVIRLHPGRTYPHPQGPSLVLGSGRRAGTAGGLLKGEPCVVLNRKALFLQ